MKKLDKHFFSIHNFGRLTTDKKKSNYSSSTTGRPKGLRQKLVQMTSDLTYAILTVLLELLIMDKDNTVEIENNNLLSPEQILRCMYGM